MDFFEDHTKVILSPLQEDYLLTYINSARQACSYNLKQFSQVGCNPDVQDRLKYSRRMLESIINIEGEAVWAPYTTNVYYFLPIKPVLSP